MSEKQVEAATVALRANILHKIREVFYLLPDRFKATELYQAAKLNPVPLQRKMIAAVLMESFKCERVGRDSNMYWKKPGAEPLTPEPETREEPTTLYRLKKQFAQEYERGYSDGFASGLEKAKNNWWLSMVPPPWVGLTHQDKLDIVIAAQRKLQGKGGAYEWHNAIIEECEALLHLRNKQ